MRRVSPGSEREKWEGEQTGSENIKWYQIRDRDRARKKAVRAGIKERMRERQKEQNRKQVLKKKNTQSCG